MYDTSPDPIDYREAIANSDPEEWRRRMAAQALEMLAAARAQREPTGPIAYGSFIERLHGSGTLCDWRNEPLQPQDRPMYTPPQIGAPSVQVGTRFDGAGMVRPAGLGSAFFETNSTDVCGSTGFGIIAKPY